MKKLNKKKHSLRSYFNNRLLLIAILSLLVVAHFWISTESKTFKHEANTLREHFIETQRAEVVFEVNKTIDYTKYTQKLIEQRLQENIKTRVYEAYSIAMNIYKEYKDVASASQITEMIKIALEPIRFNNGRDYYFIEDISAENTAIALMLPGKEGEDRYNVKDVNGKYFIREMVDLVKTEGEGFVTYYRELPFSTKPLPKISFVKLFEPYNWFIGTGEYLDDVEKDIQKESLERLSQIRFNKSGYIYVNTYDGISLIKDGKIVEEHLDLWEYIDPDGNKVIQMEREAIKNPTGGFINYFWPKIDSNVHEMKISFVRGFPEWQWMIGAGFYVNDIEPEIDILRQKLKQSMLKNILKIVIILFSVTLVVLFMGRFFYNRIWKNIQIFMTFYKKAADESLTIELNDFNIEEFAVMAKSANAMISGRNETMQLLQDSEEKLRLLFDNMQNGLAYHKIILDEDEKPVNYVFVSLNDAYVNLTGLIREEVIGKQISDVLPDFEIETTNWIEVYGKVAMTGQSIKFESYSESLSKWFSINAYSPKKGYFATIIEDISARKKIETERNENRERLKVINKLLRHDLTNDYSVIRSAIRLYKSNGDKSMLQEIDKRVDKGLNTIEIVRKQESLLNRHYDLYAINLTEILETVQKQYPKIEFDLQHEYQVFADEVIQSVVDNISNNAFIHGLATKLIISVTEEDEYYKLSFADDGVGIPDEVKGKIFEEGFIYGKSGNTGIGLYIVSKTVERYDGFITVKDNQPDGTIFEIKLRKFK
jgi:PAS domain S-box-containing protein